MSRIRIFNIFNSTLSKNVFFRISGNFFWYIKKKWTSDILILILLNIRNRWGFLFRINVCLIKYLFSFISESTSKMLIKTAPRRNTHAEIFSHTFLCFMWHGACHHGKCRASARFSECEVSQQKYLCHVTLRHFWQKNKNGSGSKMGLVAQRTYCGHTVVSFAWRPTESVFS